MTALLERTARHRFVAASAIAMAALVLQPGTADAGACKETTRNGKMTDAQLSFRNATKEQLTIKFYRGHVKDEQLKKAQTIGAGKRAQNNYAAKGWYENVTPIGRIAIGGTEVMECSFRASNTRTSEGLGKSHWKEGGCVAFEAAKEVCPTCTATCEKSYVPGKSRWETQFTVIKPSGD